MKVWPVTIVIPGEKKLTRPRIVILALILLVSSLTGQDKVEGKITYLTVDRIYTDLGSESGIALGDTLSVQRRDAEQGLLKVESLARSSSVCTPLVDIAQFQLGDLVLGTMKNLVPQPVEESTRERIAKPPPEPTTPKWQLEQTGTVSLRAYLNGYSQRSSASRMAGTFQYGGGLKSPWEFKVWAYGRADETGDLDLYTLRTTFRTPNNRLSLQGGRLYPAQLVGIGATDGLLTIYQLGKGRETGALAGYQPEPGTLEFNVELLKLGWFYEQPWEWRESFTGTILGALVGQYTAGEVDREFVYLRGGANWNNRLRLSFNQTIDFYRNDQPADRSAVTPVSSQVSLRYSASSPLSASLRYSARRQVLYRSLRPAFASDSLFEDALRSGWYTNLRYRHSKWGTLGLSANLRTQSSGGDPAIYAGFYYTPVTRLKGWEVDIRSAILQNPTLNGWRSRLGGSRAWTESIRSWVEYELYLYGYGSRWTDFIRNGFQAGGSWRLRRDLSLNARVSLSGEQSFQEIYLYSGLSYRF